MFSISYYGTMFLFMKGKGSIVVNAYEINNIKNIGPTIRKKILSNISESKVYREFSYKFRKGTIAIAMSIEKTRNG